MSEITDPTVLAQLSQSSGEITDPALLAHLNGGQSQSGLMDPEGWKRAAGLTARNVLTGVAALPLGAMDLGVWGRNVAGNAYNRAAGKPATPDYEMPSSSFQSILSGYGMPTAQTGLEKVGGVVEQGLAGAAVPVGQLEAGAQAPAGFVSPDQTRRQLLADSLKHYQDQGFKIPPSTTNPSALNTTLESIAGKENVQNYARIANDKARTAVAARALGLNPDAPLTPQAVKETMAEAGKSFEAAKAIPKFQTSSGYLDDLAKVLQEHSSANESFPGASRPDVEKTVNTYLQDSMTGKSGVSAMKLLREKATDSFSSGDSEMGRTYKGISQAIEDELERAAQNPASGQNPNLIAALRAGRQQYAKAALVRDSMLPDGTISGPKLAAAWRNDEPITGPLRDAAEFAAQFGKANLPSSSSGSPVSHLAGGIGPLLAGSAFEALSHGEHGILPMLVGGVAYPTARAGTKNYLLSAMGQRGAIPSAASAASGQLRARALAAALAAQRGQSSQAPP